MRKVIKLTDLNGKAILIGVDSIIEAHEVVQNNNNTINPKVIGLTKISSREAMVTSNFVKESIEEIHKLINE